MRHQPLMLGVVLDNDDFYHFGQKSLAFNREASDSQA